MFDEGRYNFKNRTRLMHDKDIYVENYKIMDIQREEGADHVCMMDVQSNSRYDVWLQVVFACCFQKVQEKLYLQYSICSEGTRYGTDADTNTDTDTISDLTQDYLPGTAR